MNTHYAQHGDSLTPIGLQLKSGADIVSLTGKVVKVLLTNKTGVVVIDETTTGVLFTFPEEGKLTYSMPSGDDRLPVGIYYLYVLVYDGQDGTERDTYPVRKREMRIVIGSKEGHRQ